MKHLVIPDCQLRPGDDTHFLRKLGLYIVEKQPEVIICLGDWADMFSLSSYDVGKKSFEGARYSRDIAAAQEGMMALLGPMWQYNKKQATNKKKTYAPRMVMCLGNHEDRINRAVNNDAKLEGLMSIDDLAYDMFGWEVHNFLEVVVIDGVAYSHYFTSGVLGRPATSAAAQLNKKHMSCVAGHKQGLEIAMSNRADGARITSIICGSCYEHSEDYLGPQGNKHFRGFIVLHDVCDGEFEPMFVSLKYLNQKYGTS